MRELEFLPAWYPQIRRRKRLIILQVWIGLALVAGFSLWTLLNRSQISGAEVSAAELNAELVTSRSQLKKLDELLVMKKQWRKKAEIVSSLGLQVETTRLLNMLESIMPPQMAISDLQLEVEDRAKPVANSLAAAAVAQSGKEPATDRRLKVVLCGLTPTDLDLANFLARLTSVSFFEHISMDYAREKIDNGHVMREFRLTFFLNLNVSSDG